MKQRRGVAVPPARKSQLLKMPYFPTTRPPGVAIERTDNQNVTFMDDGSLAPFSVAVRNHLNATYPGRWIGRCGPIA
ncbi:hypothetical protein TNCV_2495541 [Trichonephila clavipes]|nr:hypothetical protein TNCV_2495541 [Trichonephila clavipes]